jgi:hypothetical protein
MKHFVSASCTGEVCGHEIPRQIRPVLEGQRIAKDGFAYCGQPATHKVGEEIPFDDPSNSEIFHARHNLTAYVCCVHFGEILGPLARQICAEGTTEE